MGGIYSGVRATQDMLCARVVIGVNARRAKHFPALAELVDQTQQLVLQRVVSPAQRAVYRTLIAQAHPLQATTNVGAWMRYLIVSKFGWRE